MGPFRCGAIRKGVVVLGILLAGLWPSSAWAGEWKAITAEWLKTLKPGFGGLSGIVVDHASGAIYVDVSDQGVYRSTDRGKTWKVVGKPFRGRTEWPGCLMLDPVGKSGRLVVATVYGNPIGVADRGEWRFLNAKSSHVDWCAIDWSDPGLKFILALKHESGGQLIVSRDGGKTFADVGKGYGPAWVFDEKTAVVAEMKTKARVKPGLLRTTDAGKTFKPVASYHARALPWWQGKTLYWLVEGALIATTDRGETWKKLSAVKDGRVGPIFGKKANHLFVLTGGGILESHDGGATWLKPIALPAPLKSVGALSWIEYDPVHDVLYAMKMGSQLFQMERKGGKE
jgi:photosystem II stability/assembly factor-like uncharacterized protein